MELHNPPLKEGQPVIFEVDIVGALEAGKHRAGAYKGTKGVFVDVSDSRELVVEVIDKDGEKRWAYVEQEDVRLDWQRYWNGEKIKDLRRWIGWTQKEMGTQIWEGSPATARKNLANLERGHYEPSASVARTLRRLEHQLESHGGGYVRKPARVGDLFDEA